MWPRDSANSARRSTRSKFSSDASAPKYADGAEPRVGRELCAAPVLAGEQAGRQREVRDDAEPELDGGGHDRLLDTARQQVPFDLRTAEPGPTGRPRRPPLGGADLLGVDVRRRDVQHLALVDQLVEASRAPRRPARRRRGSAGSRGRCDRCRAGAGCPRTPRGCVWRARPARTPRPSGGAGTCVAITTSSRASGCSAAPRNSSDLPPPYISAVSKWVIPASSAAWTTADRRRLVELHAEVVAAEADHRERRAAVAERASGPCQPSSRSARNSAMPE